MFKFLKKRDKNNTKEIKEYTPSQNECTSVIRLNEKVEEFKAAYTLMENRVLNYMAAENISYTGDLGVINSLTLFHEDIVTNMKFMTSNNQNGLYSELIIEFNILKELFENLINDVYQQQNDLNNISQKCK